MGLRWQAAFHAEGVTDSSRWSADHRITKQQIRHTEGVQDGWHAFSVQTIIDVIRWSSLPYDHRLLSQQPSGLQSGNPARRNRRFI